MKKAKRILKTLDYLPRWAWYTLSFFVFPPFGPVVVYLVFHALNKAALDETDDEDQPDWVRAASSYMDDECIVSDDQEIIRQWEQTEANARRAAANWQAAPGGSAPDEEAASQAASSEPASDADPVDDIIREGNAALRRIRQANDAIADAALSAQIDSIENSCSQILSILEQRPQLLGELRTFLRYYLPTTLKLLDARVRLENGASTPKAREIRTRISEAVGVIDKAFKKQVEALDAYRFIDLESEMDVLRDMLRADGFIDDEAPQDDPFAAVIRHRRPAAASSADADQDGKPLASP